MLALDRFGIVPIGPEADSSADTSAPAAKIQGKVADLQVSSTAAMKGALLTTAFAAPAPEPPFAVPEPRPARRFAYLPQKVLPLLSTLHDDEEGMGLADNGPSDAEGAADDVSSTAALAEALNDETENPDFWTSETHREIAALEQKAKAPSSVVRRAPSKSLANNATTLESRLAEISPAAGQRLREKFRDAKVAWPPKDVSLVAIKDEKVVQLYAHGESGDWQFVHSYPVLAASGGSGPKLKRGDKQVPEGVYGISFLNPNSRYHVSLRVNYPNKFDREMAASDGRKDLGGDIMIHGKNVSAGCLAVGDEAAEELFVLGARIGIENVQVIIAPTDFRNGSALEVAEGQPGWLPKLYTQVSSAMTPFKRPSSGLLSFFGN